MICWRKFGDILSPVISNNLLLKILSIFTGGSSDFEHKGNKNISIRDGFEDSHQLAFSRQQPAQLLCPESRYLVEDLRWDGATMAVQVTSLKTHYFAIFQGTTWHFINYPLGSLLFQEYKHLLSATDTYSRGNWNTIRVSDKYGQTLNMDNLSQGYVSQVYVKSTYLDSGS